VIAVQSHTVDLGRKLRMTTKLSDDDIAAVEALPFDLKVMRPRSGIVYEGDRPDCCRVVVSGMLCRSKSTEEGKRQYLSFHIPGDIPDLQSLHLNVMDHDILALTETRIALVSHRDMHKLSLDRPRVALALWRDTLIDASVFREWILNVGRRDAPERLAHLICEVGWRMKAMGLGEVEHFEMPINQTDLADALGITSVHVNRVLQDLRRRELLEFKAHVVTIKDGPGMMKLSGFDPQYLHQSVAY
jgi:CRP-like cAMP-binding protein